MAWAEVTFATSPEHEALIDSLYNLFYTKPTSNSQSTHHATRSVPWVPHLSLCYDNPDGFPHNLSRKSIKKFIHEKCPALESAIDHNRSSEGVSFSRGVSGISLWRTAGTMSQWECLDRIDF